MPKNKSTAIIQPVFRWLFDPQLLPVLGLLSTLFVLDFTLRFVLSVNDFREPDVIPMGSGIQTIPVLDDDSRDLFFKKLEIFSQPLSADSKNPSQIEEKDTSIPEPVLEGAGYYKLALSKIRLVAIAQRQKPFAVFERVDSVSGQRGLVSLSLRDTIDEHRLVKLGSQQVSLATPDGLFVEFILFEPEAVAEAAMSNGQR